MAGIFNGNRDIKVTVESEKAFYAAILNKAILITIEADIPIQKFDGKNLKAELESYLTANALTAPLLLDAATKFSGQIDTDGNAIYPEYVYVIGGNGIDEAASVTEVTAAIEAATADNDFYFLVPVFNSVAMRTWFATYGNTYEKVMFTTVLKTTTFTDPEKSDRGVALVDDLADKKLVAWAGRVTPYANETNFSHKTLTGVTAESFSDAEVGVQESEGKNVYRKVGNYNLTSGNVAISNTTSTVNPSVPPKYIDTIIVRDTVKSVVATALLNMIANIEKLPMDIRGQQLIKSNITEALEFLGKNNYIAINSDSKQYEYTVTVPNVTASMRANRVFDEVVFSYVPSYGGNRIIVTAKELLKGVEA